MLAEALDMVFAPRPHHGHTVLSGVLGSISIAFWILVFTPQIWENYKRRSSEGLSISFIIIWLLGDIFNVLGASLQHVLPTMIILAAYYTVADIILLIQCIVYGNGAPVVDAEARSEDENTNLLSGTPVVRKHKEAMKNTAIVLCVVVFGILGYIVSSKYGVGAGDGGNGGKHGHHHHEQPVNFWGQVLGWICAVLYLASRLPQIKLNYDRKSTDGISLLFFIFAVLGNITYIISILAADSSKHAIFINASWLAGSVGTLFLDFIIFTQFITYQRQ